MQMKFNEIEVPLPVKRVLEAIQRNPTLRSVPYLVAASLAGLVAVAYGQVFHFAGELSRAFLANHRWGFLILSPLCFVGGWWIVYRFAPAARGSGIPQVMATVEGDLDWEDKATRYLLGWRVGVAKVCSSLLCILGGGAIGREGPSIQLAAIIFYWTGITSRRFLPVSNFKHWVIAGGAAGLAAAFNTPLGGIVFALEELATFHFNQFKTALLTAVIVSGMVAQWIVGPYLYLGYPKIGIVPLNFGLMAILVGVSVGAIGAVFGVILHKGVLRFSGLAFRERAILAATCGFLVALAGLLVHPELQGDGMGLVRSLLFTDEKETRWIIAIGRFFTTIVTYFAGCAGGIFAPALGMGALLGAKIDALIGSGNANLMMLLGMTAFLSAVTRAPFTALIIVLEMTDRRSIVFLLMLASSSASFAAHWVDREPLYRRMMLIFMREAGVETPAKT